MLCLWSFFLFLCFSQQIATQIAVLIAKVARLDCPRQWPELIPILLESVKGQDGLQQHRALLTFYHVTKTLASKRLAQDRRLFQDVSPQFLSSPLSAYKPLQPCFFLSFCLPFLVFHFPSLALLLCICFSSCVSLNTRKV